MKKYLFPLLVCFIASCATKEEKQDTEEVVTTEPVDTVVNEMPVKIYNPNTELYVWRATADYEKKKNPALAAPSLPVDSLIKGLNEYYENVFLEKVKQGGDTLYTVIRESEHLTQRMGSTGSEIYVADVVLNLTSVPGIKYVKIDFKEGDHAQPGVWTAANFKSYKEKKP